MSAQPSPVLRVAEGRFARLEAIEWWDQPLLARSRVLVVGAGALGNEVIKNLALLGVGHLAIADFDRIELSNLSRSVLFRARDAGRGKAECAAAAARDLYPEMRVHALDGNVLADLGLGWFRWADVVIGALDNREARVFVNGACARVGRPWFDGGIDVFQGVVRGFHAPATACYECTMGEADWAQINQRRSCSLLARRAIAQRGTPTTPIAASVVGALQVQEVVKHLHRLPALLGGGVVFDGAGHAGYRSTYPIAPDCPWHEPPAEIEAVPAWSSETTLAEIWSAAERRLGPLDAIDFSRELVERTECPACRRSRPVFRPAEGVEADDLRCPGCGGECAPVFFSSVGRASPLLSRRLREAGVPAWDVLWARSGGRVLGFEPAGDGAILTGENPANPAVR